MITVRIEDYDWGTLRVIQRDNSYTCIIHPEHAERIAAMKPFDSISFIDEQGMRWKVVRDCDILYIRSGRYEFNVVRSKLERD